MEYPSDLKYTEEHEWVRLQAEGGAVVGITAFAQAELGEIVYVELPEAGRVLDKGDVFCVVESTKAASDVYSPINGVVKESNAALKDNPGLVNSNPYDQGWIVELEDIDAEDLDELMNSEEYALFVEGE
ncbi:MAG: glycine cleavage system protein GcvH [Deltaproteobacteria bacterium]|nr:glycine cleavage system protein GcvH [Deltaproteobacteria bacterium]